MFFVGYRLELLNEIVLNLWDVFGLNDKLNVNTFFEVDGSYLLLL